MSHYFKEGGWISKINLILDRIWRTVHDDDDLVSLSLPLPSTMVEVVVVDDIVAVTL